MINRSNIFRPKEILPHLIPLAKCNSSLHGIAHWTRVHRYGLLLAKSLALSTEEK